MRVTLLKSHMEGIGGLEKVTVGLVKAFARLGAEVTLLTTNAKRFYDLPARVVNLGYKSKFSLKHLRQFDRLANNWLKQHPQDIVFGLDRNAHQTHYRAGNGVHAAYLKQRLPGESFFKRFSIKLNPLHRYILRQERRAFTSPYLKKLFTNSKMVKEQLQEFYNVSKNKLFVVPNGVDWQGLESAFEQRKAHTPFRFLFVGNGYKRKGLLHALKALSYLSSFEFELHVVGKDKKQYDAPDNVIFHGKVSDLTPYYQMCDALLVPSVYDPFANVTVEALAMGLFVVSSRSNGGHEILTKENGICIDDLDDPESVAAAMRHALTYPLDPKAIRESVSKLDFSEQLDTIARLTMNE